MPRTDDAGGGWDWFDTDTPGAPDDVDAAQAWQVVGEIAARCFRGRDGQRLLAHLRQATIERVISPDTSEARLRHLEGQRHLVRHIEALVAAGGGSLAVAVPQTQTEHKETNND